MGDAPNLRRRARNVRSLVMADYRNIEGLPTPDEVRAAIELVLMMTRTAYVHQRTTRAVGECLSEQLNALARAYSELHADAQEIRDEQEAYRRAVQLDDQEGR